MSGNLINFNAVFIYAECFVKSIVSLLGENSLLQSKHRATAEQLDISLRLGRMGNQFLHN